MLLQVGFFGARYVTGRTELNLNQTLVNDVLKNLFATGALALAASTANAALVDFNALSGNVSGVNLGGVTITAGASQVTTDLFGNTPYGTRGILAYDPNCGCFPDLFRATFDGLVSAVSVDLGDLGADEDNLFLMAYSAGDVLIDQFFVTLAVGVAGMRTLTVAGANISYVVFGGSGFNGENNVYADNLVFAPSVSTVPLPAGGLLLLGALTGLGLARRRKSV